MAGESVTVGQAVQLALQHQQAGRLAEAEHIFRQLIAQRPELAQVHFHLGNLLASQRRFAEAEQAFRAATEALPGFAEAHCNLGSALRDQGREEESVPCFRRAAELAPGLAEAHYNLGCVLRDRSQFDGAAEALARAVALEPQAARNHFQLGNALMGLADARGAADAYLMALKQEPDHAEARWALAMVAIPAIPQSAEEVARARGAFAEELAALEKWFTPERVPRGFFAVGSQQPFYLAYHEEDNRALFARYGKLCVRLLEPWQEQKKLQPAPRLARARLKLGIVSAHVYNHSVWTALVKGWLRHLDRSRIEVALYHLGMPQDAETGLARALAEPMVEGRRSFSELAEMLHRERFDVLLYPEVGMEAATARAAALRLAPVQAASWGHPETSGLPTVDHYISAAELEPEGAQAHYTEKLVPLAGLGCCYERQPVTPAEPDLGRLVLEPGVPLLLCPGTPFKYAPRHDRVLAEIARRLGRCRMLFFMQKPEAPARLLQERLRGAFARAGVDFERHVAFVPWQTRGQFYRLLERADLYLDTIGFSGFNTAMQAVECGLPIVTREGRFLRGRLASGILKRIGLAELVTEDEEEYVELAVKTVQEKKYNESVRKKMTSNREALFDDKAPVRDLEKFLLGL